MTTFVPIQPVGDSLNFQEIEGSGSDFFWFCKLGIFLSWTSLKEEKLYKQTLFKIYIYHTKFKIKKNTYMIPLNVLKTDYFAKISIIKISKRPSDCCRGPSGRRSLLRINWGLLFGHHNYGLLSLIYGLLYGFEKKTVNMGFLVFLISGLLKPTVTVTVTVTVNRKP